MNVRATASIANSSRRAAAACGSHRRQSRSNPNSRTNRSIAFRVLVGVRQDSLIPFRPIRPRAALRCHLERFRLHTFRDQFILSRRAFEVLLHTALIESGAFGLIGTADDYE